MTDAGREAARRIGCYLKGVEFESVRCSPLIRARETCELAGLAAKAAFDDNLLEWDYGVYEGRTTLEIREQQPDWSVWKSRIEGGESLDAVASRAAKAIERATADSEGNVAIFAHGHLLRILASVWIGLPPITGRYLALDTATVSVLGYERQTRVIRQWNIAPTSD